MKNVIALRAGHAQAGEHARDSRVMLRHFRGEFTDAMMQHHTHGVLGYLEANLMFFVLARDF